MEIINEVKAWIIIMLCAVLSIGITLLLMKIGKKDRDDTSM